MLRCIRMIQCAAHAPRLPVGLQPTDLDPWRKPGPNSATGHRTEPFLGPADGRTPGSIFCADAASNDRRPSAGELVGDAEFVQKRLGFEIGDPDRRDLPASDSPNVDDFDYCVGAGNSHVDYRGYASALRDNAVIAEAREVEHIGEVGQYFVSKERCARMCAAPGKIIGRGYLEVGIH